MDGRGRLAQSLTSNPDGFFAVPGLGRVRRAQRLARRWLAPVLRLDPPRGVGVAAAAVLILGSAGYGAVKGGHLPEVGAELQNLCDGAANRVGFRISSVALSGEKQLTPDAILSFAGIGTHSSLLCLDADVTRTRLKQNPWIADATVLKLYPGRLRLEIKEREAYALWQKDGDVFVIASDGSVLEPFGAERFASLPRVVGTGAEFRARDFLMRVERYPVIREAVEASVLVAERRWNLRLKNGIDVRLPETEVDKALQTLAILDREKKLLSRDIVAIDLRLSDRVTVRLSDGAAQARDAAIKARDKKPKRKGGEA
jgi:cell division protein FtsQ